MPEGLPRREEERLRRHTFWPSSRIFLVAYTSNGAMELTSKIKPSSYDNTTFNLPFLTKTIVLTYKRVNLTSCRIIESQILFSLLSVCWLSVLLHITGHLTKFTSFKLWNQWPQPRRHNIMTTWSWVVWPMLWPETWDMVPKKVGKVTIPIFTTFPAYSFYKYIQYLLWTRHCTGLWACNGEQTQYSPHPHWAYSWDILADFRNKLANISELHLSL